MMVFIFFMAKKIGKNKSESQLAEYKPEQLPNSGNGLPKEWAKTASETATKLWNILKDWRAPFAHTDDRDLELQKLIPLTNDQLRVVANVYNAVYGAKDGKTLRIKIADEYFIDKRILNPLMQRFNEANIK